MDYRTLRAKAKHPTERQKQAAANLQAGMTIKDAMVQAGYAQVVADQGSRAIPLTVQALITANHPLVVKGRTTALPDMRHMVLGRLLENCEKGQDKGVLSAKALGSIKELGMFTPDVQAGVVVLNMPVTAKPNDLPDSED